MASRPARYIIDRPEELDRQFYNTFDPSFLYRRAQALSFALGSPEAYGNWLRNHPAWPDEPSPSHAAALSSELHFLEVHVAEVTFALLFAPFQPLPHWLFLTDYKTEELTDRIIAFSKKDFGAASNDACDSMAAFVMRAVYPGMPGKDGPNGEPWSQNLDNLGRILRRSSERYLNNRADNNAYKHGLRIVPAPDAKLDMSVDGTVWNRVLGFESGLRFLELKPEDGGLRVHVATKEIKPFLSQNYVFILTQVLESACSCRRARLNGEATAEYKTFFGTQVDALLAAEPVQRFTFSA